MKYVYEKSSILTSLRIHSVQRNQDIDIDRVRHVEALGRYAISFVRPFTISGIHRVNSYNSIFLTYSFAALVHEYVCFPSQQLKK